MYRQLPDCDDFRGFDTSRETDLTAIPKRIYEGVPKPSRLILKHHLFVMHMPKKSSKGIRKHPYKIRKMDLIKRCYFGERAKYIFRIRSMI